MKQGVYVPTLPENILVVKNLPEFTV